MRLKQTRMAMVSVPFSPDLPWGLVKLPVPISTAEWEKFREVLDVMGPGFVNDAQVTMLAEIGPPAPFAYYGWRSGSAKMRRRRGNG